MSLDLTKPIKTRHGKDVTILATDVRDQLPLEKAGGRQHGQTILAQVGDYVGYFFPDGKFDKNTPLAGMDLVNPPVEVKTRRYVNVEPSGNVRSTQSTDGYRSDRPIIEFTVTDGVLTNVEIVK
jgi:hypothetical protein